MRKLDFTNIEEPTYFNMGTFYGERVYMTVCEIRQNMSIDPKSLLDEEVYFIGAFEGKNIYMTKDKIKKYTGRTPRHTVGGYNESYGRIENYRHIHPIEKGDRQSDDINHPSHYTAHKIECIQVTELFNFCLGNVIKYVWRAGLKPGNSRIDDLKKAAWYLDREIKKEE